MCLFMLNHSQVDIPIKIHNGDTALVTFTGLGYDKRMMGDTLSTKEKNTDIVGMYGEKPSSPKSIMSLL